MQTLNLLKSIACENINNEFVNVWKLDAFYLLNRATQ